MRGVFSTKRLQLSIWHLGVDVDSAISSWREGNICDSFSCDEIGLEDAGGKSAVGSGSLLLDLEMIIFRNYYCQEVNNLAFIAFCSDELAKF